MQPRTVENIMSISGVLKMKFHNLVKLMHKDRNTDVFSLDAVEIHRRLDDL